MIPRKMVSVSQVFFFSGALLLGAEQLIVRSEADEAVAPESLSNVVQTQVQPQALSVVVPVTDQKKETASVPSEPVMSVTLRGSELGATRSVASVKKDPDSVDAFMDAQTTKRYSGSKISLQMVDTDIKDIVRAIAQASEFNIITTDAVKGRMTIDFADIPWDQALDVVLKAQGLAAERNGNVVRVLPLGTLRAEKEDEVKNRILAEQTEPLVSKIIPISYANPDDLKKILISMLPKDPSDPKTTRGSIEVDSRTNTLLVKETYSNVEKFRKIIKELDTPTPQILIEGKLVAVSESHSKNFMGRIYGTTRAMENGSVDFQWSKNNAAFFGGGTGTGLFSQSPIAVTDTQGGISLGFAPKIGLIPGLPDIATLLKIEVTDLEKKIISSPRIVTQNKKEALITSGQIIYQTTMAGVGAAGSVNVINATLTLKVKPQVTNDGSINVSINFQDSSPSASLVLGNTATESNILQSDVLVENGATIVLGGVYKSTTLKQEGGIPFLKDIPILGFFFSSKLSKVDRSEIFIFLTPRILNSKEAGIAMR